MKDLSKLSSSVSIPKNVSVKVIIIGDAGTGKSCVLHRFVHDTFSKDQSQTIGVEFGNKKIDIGDTSLTLQIWDTAGQERYKSVTRSYYRGAAGALVVYDVSNRESYNQMHRWIADAKSLSIPNAVIMCIGNKRDMEKHRQVSLVEASNFALENNILFLEVSAMTGEAVGDAFNKLSKLMLQRIKEGELDIRAMYSGVLNKIDFPSEDSKNRVEKEGSCRYIC